MGDAILSEISYGLRMENKMNEVKNCDGYQLKEIVANKKLICFGMGKFSMIFK